jgi:hypothetical protein
LPSTVLLRGLPAMVSLLVKAPVAGEYQRAFMSTWPVAGSV